ncbi:energy-coupling factor transporter transmembrane protein EcfT [uncultured Mitsuokella sp.]|jgi:energy-coupling factor transport system permease protein|uniref:energy-coupling factor transporter transmembrane component T family protein n=1 Tax=uncultured Mitsuokella sp. TaxID=453120 RepID=UPI0025CFED4D|nr:energy-coupling factor transporter transmembrane component T [uncultured Mitsuokella sp.]
MLSDITIGQYFPGSSILHRLDPRTKVVLLFFYLVLIFVCRSAISYAILSALTFALMVLSKVPLRMMLRSLKPLWWIILFTFVIHVFSTPGEELAKVWIFSVTWEGIVQGFYVSLRLVLLILLSSLLTFTTSPLKLTDAMEALLAPFKRIGVPAHELAMMMTIALRFVPTLIQETDRIMKAQQSRGANFTDGSIAKRLRAFVPVLVPLFLSAFRRADDLAMAMEARCYRGGEGRTQMKALKITSIDYVAWGFTIVLIAAVIVLR